MTRPTLGTVSGEMTASGSITIDATTRAIWIVMFGGSNTTFTHGTQTASLGGLSATLHQTNLQTQVHVCGYYIEDIALRSNNTLTLGGTVAYGTSINQYRVRVYNINHATHKVLLDSENGVNGNISNGSSWSITVGTASIDTLAIIAANMQNTSQNTGTGQTDIHGATGSPAGTTHRKRSSWENITGTHAVFYQNASGANAQGAAVATAWKEGAALAPRNATRVWVLGALPSVSLPVLPFGLQAARSLPVAA